MLFPNQQNLTGMKIDYKVLETPVPRLERACIIGPNLLGESETTALKWRQVVGRNKRNAN